MHDISEGFVLIPVAKMAKGRSVHKGKRGSNRL